MKFYLRIEGVNLANFVYDSQDLSTVRGGSLLLLDAIEEVRQNIPSVQLDAVTTGASSGLFQFDVVDEAAAESVRQEVERFLSVHPQFKHATFVVDIQCGSTDFVRDREALLARNRWRQMYQPTVAIPAWNTQGGLRVCEIDRLRTATHSMPGPKGTPERVSASVWIRREFGRTQKQQFYEQQTGAEILRRFAQNLDELTSDPTRGNLHHKMAVIYLDGNGFGALQNKECVSSQTQRQFDVTIKDYRRTMLKALLRAMEDEKSWISQHDRYCLETLLWGGDEIIWVVPAWQGWNTLALFYQQSRHWEFAGQRLTHAAGLVFCHHTAPIHRITTLARDLAELAKETSRKDSLFAYQVLESFDHIGRDLKEFLTERYGEPKDLVLSGDRMDGVAEAFAQLKREEALPRRKLHQIVHQLPQDMPQVGSIIHAVTQDLNVVQGGALMVLRNYFGTHHMGWLHLAELWDYVGS
jgi:hypothetical protein